jgi:HNH endonuclease
MKVDASHSTYKVTLLLSILDALDANRASAQSIPVNPQLAEAFDQLLIRHAAFEGPGRWYMPAKYLATRKGDMLDQFWDRERHRLLVHALYQPVLAEAEGRSWLRGVILEWLNLRADPNAVALAQLLRQDLGEEERSTEVDRLEEIWEWWSIQSNNISISQLQKKFPLVPNPKLLSAAHSLEQMGLIVAEGALIWSPQEGDLATGWAISKQLAEGDTSMKLLDTKSKRRQGQQAWRCRVLANFKTQCAVCPIGLPQILEAAHLLPVSRNPERGLALANGLSLCRNHHRAMDEGMLALDGNRILHHFRSSGAGLAESLRRRPITPRFDLAIDGLAFRLIQFHQISRAS